MYIQLGQIKQNLAKSDRTRKMWQYQTYLHTSMENKVNVMIRSALDGRSSFICPAVHFWESPRRPGSNSETRLRRRGVVAERIENEILVIGGLHHLNTDTPMETESWTINQDESIGDEKLIGDALLNFAFSRSFLVEEGFCH